MSDIHSILAALNKIDGVLVGVDKQPVKEAAETVQECGGDMMMSPSEPESGITISTNQDTRSGRKSVTVTADGEAADELMQLLAMAGLGGGHRHEVDEEYANEPDPAVADAHTQLISLSGGLGKPQTMVKHGYQQGDNPLAMNEEVAKMANRLKAKFKG